jgi:hypothetical protein
LRCAANRKTKVVDTSRLRRGAHRSPVHRRLPMLDLLFIGVTVAFFAITLAYTRGCERR